MEVSREVLKMYEAFRDPRWANSGNREKKENCQVSGENRKYPETTAGDVCDGQAYTAKDTMKVKFYQAARLEDSSFKPLLFQLSIFEWMGIRWYQRITFIWNNRT